MCYFILHVFHPIYVSMIDSLPSFNGFKREFDEMFKDLPVDKLYTRSEVLSHSEYVTSLSENNLIAIIDQPEDRLGLELVSLNIPSIMEQCKAALECKPGFRSAKLLAIVRGQGGGKTRCLEELRLALLNEITEEESGSNERGILPLAITFNSNMALGKGEISLLQGAPTELANLQLNYAYAIVKRLAGVLYGRDFADIGNKFIRPALIEPYCEASRVEVVLIRAFLSHAAEKTGRHRVVVLLDEAKRAAEKFLRAKSKQKGSLSNDEDEDITSTLRSAVLDAAIPSCAHAALVISSLAIGPAGATSSGRPIIPICLPDLDPNLVVSKLWKIPEPKAQYFIPLASSLCQLPRLVECAGDAMPKYLKGWTPEPGTSAKLLQQVKASIRGRYGEALPTLNQVHAIVFTQEVAYNDDSMKAPEAVIKSIFTNSFKRFEANMKFSPVASLAFLSAVVEEKSSAPWTSKLSEFIDNLQPKTVGDPLEWCVQWWLELRLLLLNADEGLELFELKTLLHLGSIARDLPACFKTFKFIPHQPHFGQLQHSQFDVPAALASELVDLRKQHDTMVLRSAVGDAFDILLVLSNSRRAYMVFIDAKSTNAISPSAVLSQKMQERKQAKQMRSFVADHLKKHPQFSSTTPETHFAFIYVSSHKQSEKVVLEYDPAAHAEDTSFPFILMFREGTKAFLGPLFDVHEAMRALTEKSTGKIQQATK